jgi:hypothetical protein
LCPQGRGSSQALSPVKVADSIRSRR